MEGLLRIVIIIFALAALAGIVILLLNPQQPVSIAVTPGSWNDEKMVAVYGAIKSPGLYKYKGSIRIENAVEMAGGFTDEADAAGANLPKWIDDGETIIIPTKGPNQPTLTAVVQDEIKINLNTAGKYELMMLPGIGEKRADDIIKLRDEKGKFERPEELLEISGISEKLLENIYDRIIVE